MEINLTINIAKDEYGKDLIIDLSSIKHLFVSGTIGSGKSTIIHNIISTLISSNSPELLRLILIDQKRLELNLYDGVPHLLTPVITDQKKAILAMKWAGKEMERRFDFLKQKGVRNIEEYNSKILERILSKISKTNKPEPDTDAYYHSSSTSEFNPPIIIVINELHGLMSAYPKETEGAMVKILEMGHKVGIHLIISTSRPNIKTFTKPMRDLISARIALQTTSMQDSKAVIGTGDACMLSGVGHMLYREGMKYIVRGQSTAVAIGEIKKMVNAKIKMYEEEDTSELNLGTPDTDESDDLYDKAKKIVVGSRKASTSWIQRKLGIGYSRAAKLIDLLEQNNVIGPAKGSAMREVYGEGEK